MKQPQGTDEQQFNRIVLENHTKIYSLFRRMVASHDEADDLTQETFIKVYKNLSKFRGDSTAFTWIYRIAVNTGINYLRKQRARRMVGLNPTFSDREDNTRFDGKVSGALLRKAIGKLSPKQQLVVLLRSYQELPFKQIATVMDSTENAAKVNYAHALKNLKKILEKMGVSYEAL